MDHYGVIMAGGGGTRFWPLSRQKKPKQLLNLTGKDLMINEAVERMASVIGKSNIFIVTSEIQVTAMIDATAGRVFPRNILAEPSARNTANCIGYSAMEILKKYGDGVIVMTPADHFIKDSDALTNAFKTAIRAAEESDKIITIGIEPEFPSTAFGYIKYDKNADGKVKPVLGFKEKPDSETAGKYIAEGGYLWNSGMFVWKASLILKMIREYAPDIYEKLEMIGKAMNTPSEQDVLHSVYPGLRNISIDYAVMEPGASDGNVAVIPCSCGWNDVGAWDTISILHERDEQNNVLIGDVTAVDVHDSVIYSSDRKIAIVGADNIIVVETPDAVMVCPKDKAQDVRKLVELLNRQDRKDLL